MKTKNFILLAMFCLTFCLMSCHSGINFSARLFIAQAEYNFGNVQPGETTTQDIIVSNPGVASLKITEIEINNLGNDTTETEWSITQILDNDGEIINTPFKKILLNSLKEITITITFSPLDSLGKSANLSIIHNADDQLNPYIVDLKGNSTQILIDPSIYDFGLSEIGETSEKDFTITNSGEGSLEIYAIEFDGSSEFSITSNRTYFSLEPGLSEIITISFTPLAAGLRKTTLKIRNNSGSSPTEVLLTGIGDPLKNYPPTIIDTNSNPDISMADGVTIVTFTANVDDPNGLQDVQSVSIDLQNFGSNVEQMFDDGSNGDDTADDGIYTYQFTVPTTLSFGNYTAQITVSDYSGETFVRNVSLLIYTGNKIYVSDLRGSDTTGNGSETEPFKTIQMGIDTAANYDWVTIEEGEYLGVGNRDLDFSSGTAVTKEIIVKSENDPAKTILNCEGTSGDNHRAFIFETSETNNSILAGLTIKNAFQSSNGGAIICTDSSPTIKSCIFDGNQTGAAGGAIACLNSEALITDCTIINNNALGGGGIYVQNSTSSLSIQNNIIDNNKALVVGGGIYVYESSPEISNNQIRENSISPFMVPIYGGGIGITGNSSAPTIQRCNISNNSVSNSTNTCGGGGIYYSSTSSTGITITNCVIENNEIISSANNSYGAGVYFFTNSKIQLTTTSIMNNVCSGQNVQGSGIFCSIRVDLTIEDCVISDNTIYAAKSAQGSGIYVNYLSTINITDTIIKENLAEANEYALGGGMYINIECTTTIDNADVSSNKADGVNAYGGGIYLLNDNELTISDTTVESNVSDANLSYGGGIFAATDCEITLTDCSVSSNLSRARSSVAYGGGIATVGVVDLSILNTNLMKNTVHARTTGYGGAISMESGSTLILDLCSINENTSKGSVAYGGAISVNGGTAEISSCFIMQNDATGTTNAQGGGLRMYNTPLTIHNSLLSNNTSEASANALGGALFAQLSTTEILSTTITQNLCQSYIGTANGGACYFSSNTVDIVNSIVWDNFVNGGPVLNGNEIFNTASTISADFCDVANTTKNSVADIAGTVTFSDSIHEDPFFVDPILMDYHLQHTSDGFLNDSPCIDAGSDSDVPASITEDLDGNPRFIDGSSSGSPTVDMGCFEKQ